MLETLFDWSLRLCAIAAGAVITYLLIYYQLAAALALWAWITN
jgi:hypothetical protein